jgi:tRNA dimethylallyltransferase
LPDLTAGQSCTVRFDVTLPFNPGRVNLHAGITGWPADTAAAAAAIAGRRVTRALERCLASGRTLAELAAEFARQPSPFAEWRTQLTLIDRAPSELEQRIALRVDAMLRAGLVDEVRGLLSVGLRDNPSAARAIGYREVIDLIEGRLAEKNLAAEIAKNTRALVRKQRTWFRTQLPDHRVIAATELSHADQLFAE